MSTIVITITDKPNDKVSIVSNPRFEDIINKNISGSNTTSAEGYALSMMKVALALSKVKKPSQEIPIFGGGN